MPKSSASSSISHVVLTALEGVPDMVLNAVQEAVTPLDAFRHADTVEAALAQEGAPHVLILSLTPLQHLATCLAQDPTHADAVLAQWQADTQAFLKQQRQNRRRITLVHPDVFDGSDKTVWTALKKRLDLDLPQVPQIRNAMPDLSGIHLLSAATLLDTDPSARTLAAEIGAIMIGADQAGPDIRTVMTVLQSWEDAQHQCKTLPKTEAALQRVQKAYKALEQNSLKEAEGSLKKTEARLKKTEARLKEAQNNQKETEKQLESQKKTLTAQVDALQHELTQTHTVLADNAKSILTALTEQKVLEQALAHERQGVAALRAQAAEGAHLAETNAALSRRVGEMENSNSWAVTRPLRAIRRKIGS